LRALHSVDDMVERLVHPQELTGIHASASPKLLSDLKTRLDALNSCKGAGCKAAEDGG
jgi:hypothetical protein